MIDISNYTKNDKGEFVLPFSEFKKLREDPSLDFVDSNTGKKPSLVLQPKGKDYVVFDMLGRYAEDASYQMMWRS